MRLRILWFMNVEKLYIFSWSIVLVMGFVRFCNQGNVCICINMIFNNFTVADYCKLVCLCAWWMVYQDVCKRSSSSFFFCVFLLVKFMKMENSHKPLNQSEMQTIEYPHVHIIRRPEISYTCTMHNSQSSSKNENVECWMLNN